jgi:hypothetical protein
MEDGSAVSIVDRLVREANLLHAAHTCLRTTAGFSWYRKANRQKARGELDLPFHHLSMELLTKCPEAGLDERRDPSPINKVLGSVMWKDKKQVGFLHTHLLGQAMVGRRNALSKNKKRRLVINCPPVQELCQEHERCRQK